MKKGEINMTTLVENQMDENPSYDISLRNRWVLWFHRVDDDNWGNDSYIKIYELETYEDILFILREVPNITSGMFFLMKDGIFPTYEDPTNYHGGSWSLRVTKKDSYDVWQKLLYYLCVDRLAKDDRLNDMLNGISISPKINNCIFKIWNTNFKGMKQDSLRKDIEGISMNPGDVFYVKHEPTC